MKLYNDSNIINTRGLIKKNNLHCKTCIIYSFDNEGKNKKKFKSLFNSLFNKRFGISILGIIYVISMNGFSTNNNHLSNIQGNNRYSRILIETELFPSNEKEIKTPNIFLTNINIAPKMPGDKLSVEDAFGTVDRKLTDSHNKLQKNINKHGLWNNHTSLTFGYACSLLDSNNTDKEINKNIDQLITDHINNRPKMYSLWWDVMKNEKKKYNLTTKYLYKHHLNLIEKYKNIDQDITETQWKECRKYIILARIKYEKYINDIFYKWIKKPTTKSSTFKKIVNKNRSLWKMLTNYIIQTYSESMTYSYKHISQDIHNKNQLHPTHINKENYKYYISSTLRSGQRDNLILLYNYEQFFQDIPYIDLDALDNMEEETETIEDVQKIEEKKQTSETLTDFKEIQFIIQSEERINALEKSLYKTLPPLNDQEKQTDDIEKHNIESEQPEVENEKQIDDTEQTNEHSLKSIVKSIQPILQPEQPIVEKLLEIEEEKQSIVESIQPILQSEQPTVEKLQKIEEKKQSKVKLIEPAIQSVHLVLELADTISESDPSIIHTVQLVVDSEQPTLETAEEVLETTREAIRTIQNAVKVITEVLRETQNLVKELQPISEQIHSRNIYMEPHMTIKQATNIIQSSITKTHELVQRVQETINKNNEENDENDDIFEDALDELPKE
ncbi:Plasmodium exported protein (PHISTb), unknown, putative [Plasmodium sp. gorilla clade G3]|nr:Plasmodium exported protein (PHISTb), unknown, putative [Plasmodium sp. gorilla clade G3]